MLFSNKWDKPEGGNGAFGVCKIVKMKSYK